MRKTRRFFFGTKPTTAILKFFLLPSLWLRMLFFFLLGLLFFGTALPTRNEISFLFFFLFGLLFLVPCL